LSKSIVTLIIAFALVVASQVWPHFIRNEQTVTVNKTEQRCEAQKTCKYLVFTDKGVYKNTDTWLEFKWNSSDMYGDLVAGKSYTIKSYGLRWSFFSWYPNIVKATPVAAQ